MAGTSGSKAEKQFLKRVKPYRDQLVKDHVDSPQEGFQYFESKEYQTDHRAGGSIMSQKIKAGGLKGILGLLKIFTKHMVKMRKGINVCFEDLEPYLVELENKGALINKSSPLLETYPNVELWETLQTYAYEHYGVRMGFTEVPEQLVFKDKTILFRYAIVCIQEMQKSEIDCAPKLKASAEVMRVYKELGIAVNEIAKWLRENYNIQCQSNHPLGGLVNTTPLAGKAGLGWQGSNGLLITPWYGQRQRIAPIFIENKIFSYTDNDDHRWIESFCSQCRRCERACPVGAIYHEKQVSASNISGIGETRTCIDRSKCFPQFNSTMGCGICMKVCPFSQGEGSYEKIKKAYDKKTAKTATHERLISKNGQLDNP